MPFWENIRQILDALAYFGGLLIGVVFLAMIITGIIIALMDVEIDENPYDDDDDLYEGEGYYR